MIGNRLNLVSTKRAETGFVMPFSKIRSQRHHPLQNTLRCVRRVKRYLKVAVTVDDLSSRRIGQNVDSIDARITRKTKAHERNAKRNHMMFGGEGWSTKYLERIGRCSRWEERRNEKGSKRSDQWQECASPRASIGTLFEVLTYRKNPQWRWMTFSLHFSSRVAVKRRRVRALICGQRSHNRSSGGRTPCPWNRAPFGVLFHARQFFMLVYFFMAPRGNLPWTFTEACSDIWGF